MNRPSNSVALRIAVAALLVLTAVALAACSSSASTPATTGTDTTQASIAATPSTTPSEAVPGTVPQATTPPVPAATDAELKQPQSAKTVAKLVIKDLVMGKGDAVKNGDNVSVDYTGWLTDGTKFDSSVGKAPLPVSVGAGSVIPGWDQGLVGMKVGGIRQLVIPADLGYGANGAGGVIPPNATLRFTVKLLSIN